MGEGQEVAAGHLVGFDPEPISDHPSLEVGGEEAVVPAQQEPGGSIGPTFERVVTSATPPERFR